LRERLKRIVGPVGSLRGQLFRSSFGSAGIKMFYVLVQFGVGVALARMLGPEALGLYAFTMALVQLLAIFAQFGFPAFLVRTISVTLTMGEISELKGLVIGAMQIVTILALIIMALASTWFIGPGLKPDEIPQHILLIGLILLPLLVIAATNGGILKGLGHVVVAQVPDFVIRPILFFIILLAFSVLGTHLSTEEALLINAGATLLALVTGLLLLRHHLPTQFTQTTAKMEHLQWLRQSLPFLLLAGAQVLNYQTDILMLGVLTTQEQTGLYRVAVQVIDGLGIVLFAISAAIAPQLARLHAQTDWPRIQRILVYSHRAAALVMLPAALVIAGFGRELLALVFGEEFSAAADALEILALGKVAYASVGFAGLALSMLGRAGAAAIITLVTVVMNITLNLYLIPHYGIEGAAMATVVSTFSVNVASQVWIWQVFSRNFSAFALIR
jgi:O-antigen/teichoic acid export membrane protein